MAYTIVSIYICLWCVGITLKLHGIILVGVGVSMPLCVLQKVATEPERIMFELDQINDDSYTEKRKDV